MNPSVFCASYRAVTPIHCTVQLRETDISLKGPKYHNLMEERLLQSRLNHLENQLRRTTLVTQRQQLHIQKTLNNIPKPSRNLDRRVAEAFRFIMAEEVYNESVDKKESKQNSSTSIKFISRTSYSPDSSCSSISEKNRLLRVVQRKQFSAPSKVISKKESSRSSSRAETPVSSGNEKWKVVSRKLLPAIRFQRRVLVMDSSSVSGSQHSSMDNIAENMIVKTEADNILKRCGTNSRDSLWRSALSAAKDKSSVSQSHAAYKSKSTNEVELSESRSNHWKNAWKKISYRKRQSEDVTSKWTSLAETAKARKS